jgi:hypothetical protein
MVIPFVPTLNRQLHVWGHARREIIVHACFRHRKPYFALFALPGQHIATPLCSIRHTALKGASFIPLYSTADDYSFQDDVRRCTQEVAEIPSDITNAGIPRKM